MYYPVLQSTTPVLQSTTPVLLSTTKYYTLVLLCTTKYYASTILYYASTTTYYSGTTVKRHVQCAVQQESASNFTKYCACHAKWMSSMICVTYETSFPMRGTSQNHPPTSPNTARATQNECHQWSASHMKPSFPMRGASKVTLQPHQILRLPRNLEAQDFSGNSLKCFRQ